MERRTDSVHSKDAMKARMYGRSFFVWGLSAALFSLPVAAENAWGGVKSSNPQEVQQTRNVTGQVLDENGEPMIGVSVLVKGTQVGAITDFDGNFKLNAPTGASELQLTYMGYKAQTVKITSGQMVVRMEPDNQLLDEVVVIGYGTMKKRDLTGSIASVKSEDIVLNPGTNPMQALQGKVAGLDITKESGQAGSGIKMQLRGTRSFAASGNPLFIIDGMPGDYATLNPNDIESIEVLKDASSTAIYGSSGANGVVLITTKSGQVGKVAVNFNAYVGFNGWSETPTMRSGESYIQTIRDASAFAQDGNWSSPADDEKLMNAVFGDSNAYKAHVNNQYIDWVDALLRTAVTQNYSLSVSGGNEKTRAYFSMNFSDEAGQFKQDNYKVYSSKLRIDHNLNDWFKMGVDAQLSYTHQNKADSDLENLMVTIPLGTLYNEDGSINPRPVVGRPTVYNYLLNDDASLYKNQTENFRLYFNPYIEISPLKGLTFRSQIGAALAYKRNNLFEGRGSVQWYKGEEKDGAIKAQVDNNRDYSYKWENILTYNFTVANDHDFTITAVTTWNHNQSDESCLYQTGITDNKFLWHNIQENNTNTRGYTNYSMSKGMGYVGRINYSYKGKYLFAASVRYDGSSRLADGNRWDTFPAFSLGWRISDEKFMEQTRGWLDNLKIRLGYGVTGTAGIDPYSSASSLATSPTAISLGGVYTPVYIYSQNVPNYTLGWEKSYSTNVGIDAAFLKNRIDVTMDYYNTKTKGVIWNRSIAVTNGSFGVDGGTGSNYQTNLNICETKNTGFELTLNTRNIVTKDFTWTSTLTYTYNKEKITKLATDDLSGKPVSNGTTGYVLAMGEAVNSFYHYKIDGIWQLGEEADAAVFGAAPGDYKINIPGMHKEADGRFYKVNEEGETVYYDKDNPYTIGGDDYQVLGHNSPDWSLGFQNTLTYKDFDLTIYAYARWGQMINYKLLGSYDPQGVDNFPTYFSYWTPDNPSNDFPAANAGRSIEQYTGYYARPYVDGSFFKIKNITLGYTLPTRYANKAGMQKCRVYATITNPFVWAKSNLIKDYDPEMNGSLKYPLTKQLVFGVNVSF